MSKPITKKTLEEFRNWLLAHASDNKLTTNHITAVALFESATRMTEWFALDPQIPDSLAATPNRDMTDLHWVRRKHCDYALQNAFGNTLGTVIGEASSTGKDAYLKFCATRRRKGVWFRCGDFDNIIDAKEAVEVPLNLTQSPGPLPNSPMRPLWLRGEGLSQFFDYDGGCAGMVTQRHIDDNGPLFLAEVMPIKDQWVRVGYLEDRHDAEHAAEQKLRSIKARG